MSEGVMGQGGMPDIWSLGGQCTRYEPDVWWRTQGKNRQLPMKQSMKRIVTK